MDKNGVVGNCVNDSTQSGGWVRRDIAWNSFHMPAFRRLVDAMNIRRIQMHLNSARAALEEHLNAVLSLYGEPPVGPLLDARDHLKAALKELDDDEDRL
jgi:hypothetical protein